MLAQFLMPTLSIYALLFISEDLVAKTCLNQVWYGYLFIFLFVSLSGSDEAIYLHY
jgi:hypothetical protein